MNDADADHPTSWVGRSVTVDIERVAHGGHCVGRVEGRVLFVRHTLPGERVVATVTEDKGGSFCRADAVRILVAAPGRVDPPCRFAHSGGCGGCDWQHASLSTQRRLKADVVREQLSRLAGIDLTVRVEELPGGATGWRTRMQYATTQSGQLGLRANHSHRVVPIDECLIAHPQAGSRKVLHRRWPRALAVEIAVPDEGPAVVRMTDRRKRTSWAHGSAHQTTHHAGGRSWRVTGGGFWQVHPDAAPTLLDAVLTALAPQPGERVLDLYAGVGLFGGVLAEKVGPAGRVLCLESAPVAVRDAEHNLTDLPQAEARVARIDAAAVADLVVEGPDPSYDLVVLDPPRTGAKAATCVEITRLRPRAIAYVACDPAALARDLATFSEYGYRLADLRAFDCFPMTQHIECVALLAPTPRPGTAPSRSGVPSVDQPDPAGVLAYTGESDEDAVGVERGVAR